MTETASSPPPPNRESGSHPRDRSEMGDGFPRRFGKYTLLRKFATGGMAELFLALQKSVAGFEKLIVIKRILPQMNQDRAFIDMFLHEARIAATLSHPNIVHIFDVGQVDGLYYIAMEHIHGEDIRSIVRQMRASGIAEFPFEHALGIVLGIAAGLSYAHEQRDLDGSPLNIVHRDVSPQNVLVTFTGDVKIVDFGIAKSDGKMQLETRSGRLKGKVPYMSPEQARGERIDARTDIFATGVLLFELTTGKRLFKGQSEYETLKLICEKDYPRPSQVCPGYPRELERIVMKALTKSRDERYPTARVLQQDLEEFVRNERIAVSDIALQQFMLALFEEKLAQKEDLTEGRQLADILETEQTEPPPSLDPRGAAHITMSTPAASRTVTVTDVGRARRFGRTATGIWIAAAAAALVLAAGAAFGVALWRKHAQKTAASQTPAAQTATKGSIRVTTDPPGAAIWINGDLQAQETPAVIGQLPVDSDVEVKLTRDGFETDKQVVHLSAQKPAVDIAATLKAGSVMVEFALAPPVPGATLSIDGTRADALTVGGLSSGNEHRAVIAAPGYVEQSFAFIGASQERKHFDVTLQRVARIPRAPGSPPPAAPAGAGKLNVGASNGWCNVTIDGVARGPTPLAGVELSAGPHKVTCAPPDKPAQNANVVVPADGTARYRFTL